MAVLTAILCPASAAAQKEAALATVTSSGEHVFGTNVIVAVNATADITIAWGKSGMAAAAATDYRIPANTTFIFDLGQTFDRIRVFNLAGSATDIYMKPLSRF